MDCLQSQNDCIGSLSLSLSLFLRLQVSDFTTTPPWWAQGCVAFWDQMMWDVHGLFKVTNLSMSRNMPLGLGCASL